MRRTLAIALILVFLPSLSFGDEIWDLIDKGQRQVQRGRLQQAYDTFKKVLELEARNGTAMNALAQISSFLELPDESVLYYASYLYMEADYVGEAEQVKQALAKQERSIKDAAKVTFVVDPTDGEILVNGLPVGKHKVVLTLAAGKDYKVSVDLEDYHPFAKTYSFEIGQERTIPIHLSKIIYNGKVKLKVIPSGKVKIYVDAKFSGTDLAEVSSVEGRRLLCFKKEGFDRWWRYVTVPRNDSIELEVNLRNQSRPNESCETWPRDD